MDKLVDQSIALMNLESPQISQIKELLVKHYEIVIYNIVSIGVVIALAANKKKLTDKDMVNIKEFIQTKCTSRKTSKTGGDAYNQQGGTALPSEYCGYSFDNARYSAGNGDEQSTSTVDFANGLIRPAIDMSGGGGGGGGGGGHKELMHFVCNNRDVKAYIRSLLKRHNLSITPSGMNILIHYIEIHMYCLLKDLKARSPLTLSKVNTVLKLKSHAIFH